MGAILGGGVAHQTSLSAGGLSRSVKSLPRVPGKAGGASHPSAPSFPAPSDGEASP